MSDLSVLKLGIMAKGRGDLEKYLQDRRLGFPAAIKAKCYDCSGGYADGKTDCQIESCPLYPWMPYRDNPPEKRKLTQKQIEASKENMRKLREKEFKNGK